jgi:hypothetical protein
MQQSSQRRIMMRIKGKEIYARSGSTDEEFLEEVEYIKNIKQLVEKYSLGQLTRIVLTRSVKLEDPNTYVEGFKWNAAVSAIDDLLEIISSLEKEDSLFR